MKRHLQLALKHLRHARPHLLAAFGKRNWPFIHEDIDHLIDDIQNVLHTLANGEQLPP